MSEKTCFTSESVTAGHPYKVAEMRCSTLRHFDLSPAGMIEGLSLQRPIYRATSVYSHFGRPYDGLHFPWEAVKPL